MIEVRTWNPAKGTEGETEKVTEGNGFGISPNGDLIITKMPDGIPPTVPGMPVVGVNIRAFAAGYWVSAKLEESNITTVGVPGHV